MLDLRNEFIFAPVKTGYSDGSGAVTERHLRFYAARSSHVGAVTPEPLYIHKNLRELPTQIGIDDDSHMEGLKKLIDTIHDKGAKVIAHLNHPGRMANPKIPGNTFVSSTDKPCENGGATPLRLDRAGMDNARDLLVAAAVRAEHAGFDIIELQMGHGYLLAQFLSPMVNDRDDEYGGSLENRMRYPLEVFEAVKDAVSLPVIVRVSGEEMTPKGIIIDETVALAKELQDRGAAAVHVSAGTACNTPPWYFQHMFVPKGKTWDFAKKVRDEAGVPVIAVGRVNTFEDIDRLKNEYKMPYIAVGRGLVADEHFIGKYLGEIEGAARPCLACADGCLGGVKAGKGLGCVVNPTVGNELDQVEPASTQKSFAVVGGGLAGMMAALTLKRRGHSVTIFEKDHLGGQFNLAWLPPKKETLRLIVDYFDEEVRHAAIPVEYKEASIDDLKDFDEVVLATGAVPAVPPVEGLDRYYWAEVLRDENLPSQQKIVVIGGGLIGIEVAHKLQMKGNDVTVVEMEEEVARGMENIERTLTLKSLNEHNVPVLTGTRVTRVDGATVTLEGAHGGTIEGVHHIVLATGMKSYNPLAESLQGHLPFHVVGDAAIVGKAQDAISSAYRVAREL